MSSLNSPENSLNLNQPHGDRVITFFKEWADDILGVDRLRIKMLSGKNNFGTYFAHHVLDNKLTGR